MIDTAADHAPATRKQAFAAGTFDEQGRSSSPSSDAEGDDAPATKRPPMAEANQNSQPGEHSQGHRMVASKLEQGEETKFSLFRDGDQLDQFATKKSVT